MISPSGGVASETVYLRDVGKRGVKELYRSGVEPDEGGVWRLRVKVHDPGDDLTGLGIICESMGHDKLRKFAENETFGCLVQASPPSCSRTDTRISGTTR